MVRVAGSYAQTAYLFDRGRHLYASDANFGGIMPAKLSFVVLLLLVPCAWTQQTTHNVPKTAPAKAAANTLPKTSPELAQAILASYYHPDNLVLMECDVSVDWDAFYHSLNMTAPEERASALKGLKIHSRSVRGRPIEVRFDWSNGAPTSQEQIENGFKQMLGGFYQMYWPILANPVIGQNDKLEQIVSLPEGGAKASVNSGGMKIQFVVNRDGAPTHYEFDGGMLKGLVDFTYMASPNPIPGDLRRIRDMKIDEQIGASSFKVDTKLEYQDVNGFSIPHMVTFSMLGAYTLNFQFTGCAASAVAVSQ